MRTEEAREREETINQRNAAKYVAEVGIDEAKRSTHYMTATICHCGTCFCCEVLNAVKKARKP